VIAGPLLFALFAKEWVGHNLSEIEVAVRLELLTGSEGQHTICFAEEGKAEATPAKSRSFASLRMTN